MSSMTRHSNSSCAGVLKGQLGTLPLDLTAEALERRRAVRETAARRRRRRSCGARAGRGAADPGSAAHDRGLGGPRRGFRRPRPIAAPEPSAVADASIRPAISDAERRRPGVYTAAPLSSGRRPRHRALVIDPHALIVLTSKAVFTERRLTPSPCGSRTAGRRPGDRCSQRLVALWPIAVGWSPVTTSAGRSSGSAPGAGPSSTSRDGHELAVDTGGALPDVGSPSGPLARWSSCPSARSEPCSVIPAHAMAAGRHVL